MFSTSVCNNLRVYICRKTFVRFKVTQLVTCNLKNGRDSTLETLEIKPFSKNRKEIV